MVDTGKTHEALVTERDLSVFFVYCNVIDRTYPGTNPTLSTAIFHFQVVVNPFTIDVDF